MRPMWEGSSFQRLHRLLAQHVRPQLGKLLVVTGLASLVAFCEKAPFALLVPLFDQVLFPNAANAEAGGGGGMLERFSSGFGTVTGWAETWWFGEAGASSEGESRLAVLLAVGGLIVGLAI